MTAKRPPPPPPALRRRGVALFLMMGTFVVLFLLAFGVATLSRQELRLTGAFVEGEMAFQVAEAGLEQAMFLLKNDMTSNRELARAMVDVEVHEIRFDGPGMRVVGDLAPPGGEVQAKVWGQYEPVDEVGATGRVGSLVLHSRGSYTSPQGRTAVRQVKVRYQIKGEDLSPVAPDHGLLIRDPRPSEYYADAFTLDMRDFSVWGGDLYLEGGWGIELTENVINREFRPMGELGLLDFGYGGPLGIFQGGVNLTHSQVMEIGRPQAKLTRKYFDFQGFDDLFGPGPAWVGIEEKYMRQARNAGIEAYDDDRINLRSPADYERLATTVIKPNFQGRSDGDSRHNNLFRNVFFEGPLGLRGTTYPKVLPLYGYGDWRRLNRMPFSSTERGHDFSGAIRLDGVTYVRGDVFLEGYYEGVGTLVVQGNLFIGGHVEGVRPWVTGYHSFLNVVVLQDPAREAGTLGSRFARKTGKVVYRPHHDMDWSSRGVPKGRVLSPFLDIGLYAQNGMEVDRASVFDKFFDMQIEFNFAADLWEFGRMPNDIRINGTDARDLFDIDPEVRRFGVSPFFVPIIVPEVERWEEEAPEGLPLDLVEDLEGADEDAA